MALLLRKHLNPLALCAMLLVAFALARIVATYRVFNQTFDEPAHIACGIEWLDLGQYRYEHQHPPLARVAAALGPYLAGIRSSGLTSVYNEGNGILYTGTHYFRTLALARMGILPFFVIACPLVWSWSRRLFGTGAALVSTLLFTMLPPILAHSGLATTDMACATFVFASTYAFSRWLERPAWRQSLLLGGSAALAALSKFSSLAFLPACMLAVLLLYWFIERPPLAAFRREALRRTVSLIFAAAVLFMVIWAGYRFSVGRVTTASRPHETIDRFLPESRLPAYEFFDGIGQVEYHNTIGHDSWLLGEYRTNGWWYFFPVVVAVKTPIAFLLLCFIGFFCLARQSVAKIRWQEWVPGVCVLVILLICMTSRIDLGVRHILPIYPLLAMVAGLGLTRLFEAGRARKAAAAWGLVLALWLVVSSMWSHPDYLAYFNELAGGKPEWVLAESDLDWGQDLQRLSNKLKELGVKEVSLAYFGTADLTRHGLPAIKRLSAYRRTTGWVAVSLHIMMIEAAAIEKAQRTNMSPFSWLDWEIPVTRVGKSIDLYYVK
ncbi:MAG: glycosyltransferase family 39 protein [Bryobacteraceae bacterium]